MFPEINPAWQKINPLGPRSNLASSLLQDAMRRSKDIRQGDMFTVCYLLDMVCHPDEVNIVIQ